MSDAAPDFASIPPADGYDSLGAFMAEVARLAALPEHEYDHARRAEAKRLGVRLTTLDKAVAAVRPREDGDATGQGEPITVEDVEPWPDPVDAAGLLDEIKAFLEDYIVLPPHAGTKVTLWIAHTHCCEAAFITPRLAITSPTKQCGKTTLLDVIGCLVCRPVSASDLTAAATFRIIALAKPTLLVDEADTFMQNNEELRGVINAGHRADGAILRVVGDDHEPRRFKVFGPCAIAGIRRLPATIADRSIHVRMVRKSRAERVQSFRADRTEIPDRLRSMLARFVADNTTRLIAVDPDLPPGAHNRFADNWRPLAAIAEAAGGDWPARARAAILHDLGVEEDAELGQQLLEDIRIIFDAQEEDRLTTHSILAALKAMDESPWKEFGRNEKEISDVKLAALLKPFGVKSATHHFPALAAAKMNPKVKGYLREDFVEAWNRYLAPKPAAQPVTPLPPKETAILSDSQPVTSRSKVTARNAPKAAGKAESYGVTSQNHPRRRAKMNGFVVTAEWQECPHGFVAPPGCEFRLDMTTGRKQIRRVELKPDPHAEWS